MPAKSHTFWFLKFSCVICALIFAGCGDFTDKTVNQPAQPHFTEIKTKETYVHTPTGMQFPTQVANFKRTKVVRYDREGTNISGDYIFQSFSFTIAELKVYIYPVETNAAGPLSLDKHYDQTRALLFNIYFDAHDLEEGEIKIGQPFGPQQGRMFTFVHRPADSFKSKSCYSRLYLFKHGPWFIKYRVTNLPKDDGKVQLEVGKFMHMLTWPGFTTVPDEEIAAPVKSFGTGFAISENGLIVTAYHVIENAKAIKVYLTKDSFVSAKVIRIDPSNDLALLQIENPTPNFLQIAPMRSVKMGDKVFTIGFPMRSVLGQEAKYTEGVVSALSGLKDASSFLQITVPVQPGNSGGPLVNERGEVVGVITSTAAILPFVERTGTLPQNINWAVKADYLTPLIELPEMEPAELNVEQLIDQVIKSVFCIETE